MKVKYFLTSMFMLGAGLLTFGQTYVNFTVSQPSQLVASAGNDHNVCRVDTVQLGGAPSATGGTLGYSYSWTTSGAISSTTASNPMGNTNVTADFILTVTDTNNCTSIDTATVNISPCTGVQEWSLPLKVAVSPNPGNGNFQVLISGNYSKGVNLITRNHLGQKIESRSLGKITNELRVDVDLSNRGVGVYYLDLISGNQHSVTKLIVLK